MSDGHSFVYPGPFMSLYIIPVIFESCVIIIVSPVVTSQPEVDSGSSSHGSLGGNMNAITDRTRQAAMPTPHDTYTSWIWHDGVIKWKHFPRYWPFVRGIHRSPVNSPHKGQWRGALMFFFDLHPNKRLSKHWWGWWFETPPCPLWRHCNDILH